MEDENGKIFYEQMYDCGNFSCKVNREISHIQRDIQVANTKTKKGVKNWRMKKIHVTGLAARHL